MKVMLILYKLCFSIVFRDIFAIKETFNKKNLQFVENLKHDLRRNNDDYAEQRRNNSSTNTISQSFNHVNINDVRYKIITTRDEKKITKPDESIKNFTALKDTVSYGNKINDIEDERIKIIDKIRRRVDKALVSKEVTNNEPQRRVNDALRQSIVNDKTTPISRSLYDIHHLLNNRNANMNQFGLNLLSNKPNGLSHLSKLKPIQNTTLKKPTREKLDELEKFKKFLRNNKGLLREFISSKKQAANMGLTTPTTQYTFPEHATALSSQEEHLITHDKDGKKIINLNLKKKLEELPNEAMLDMFPAKGGRIHSKRVKGRLCHRHVLVPEGPKYNSRGEIYLPPHAAAPGMAHEYNVTEVPKFLLPRCCNCCRKSVLGCE